MIINLTLIWGTELLSRDTAIYTWTILLGVGVLYLVWTSFKAIGNKSQWVFTALIGLLMVFVFNGRKDQSLGSLIDAVLPPVKHIVSTGENLIRQEESNEIIWYDSLDLATQIAKKEGKRVLLEFTGYTCVNCRWMEQNILANREVHEMIKKSFVAVRLYTDGGKDADENLKMQIDRFQTIALPYYATLTDAKEIQSTSSGVTYQYKEFISFLKNVTQK